MDIKRKVEEEKRLTKIIKNYYELKEISTKDLKFAQPRIEHIANVLKDKMFICVGMEFLIMSDKFKQWIKERAKK
jgi:hypothetical protein